MFEQKGTFSRFLFILTYKNVRPAIIEIKWKYSSKFCKPVAIVFYVKKSLFQMFQKWYVQCSLFTVQLSRCLLSIKVFGIWKICKFWHH